MSAAHRKSILLQLQDDPSWAAMSEEDRGVCQALYEAILSVQRPQWFGTLPGAVRKPLMRWRKAQVRKHHTSRETIQGQLQFAEQLGLKRTRGHRGKVPGQFAWVARRLRISENTVANKASRQLPRTLRKR